MGVSLTPDLRRWIERETDEGRHPSEEAVTVAALKVLRARGPMPGIEEERADRA